LSSGSAGPRNAAIASGGQVQVEDTSGDQADASYVLTVGKGGLKLPKATEGDSIDFAPVQGERPSAPCGRITVAFERAAGLDIEGRQVTMTELIRALSGMLGRPVIDMTRFSGKFDISMGFGLGARRHSRNW
jgi:uncharacterized protein (TIGR03435 family)